MPDEQDTVPTETETTDQAEQTESELDRLRRELAETQQRAEEYFGNWQRSAADLSNFRRRVDQERVDLQKYASADVLAELLSVVDDWERALAVLPPEMLKFTWVHGTAQIFQKLQWTLSRHGVTPIDAADKPFDPHEHDAVMRDEDVPATEQTHVVQELQRGYRIHERVLRAALVKVGRPPEATAAGGESSQSEAAPEPGDEASPSPEDSVREAT
ncbi:MAG TPA: nucleotide exchange factor GrpE [Chloroflexota bacterium]|jgi:molecular chaperone GrpE|nr:nucleotide exchange factor GrpE [Chloroflexota bacterium]